MGTRDCSVREVWHMLDARQRTELVKRRAGTMRAVRNRRTSLLLTLASGVTSVALVATIMALSKGGFSAVQGLYGSVLRYGDVGGYVLVALCSFVAASALTVVCHRFGRRRAVRAKALLGKDGNDV